MNLLTPASWAGRINIGGWIPGAGMLDVVEPATGNSLGTVGAASADDVAHAAAQGMEAQRAWARTVPDDRAAVLRRAGELFQSHAGEIQGWIITESGAIGAKAAMETDIAAGECFEAAALPTHPAGDVLASAENRWSFARRKPAGVVGVVSPFNFPLILSIRSVAPALALGNAVVLKPDPRTSVSGGVVLMRIFEEAGLPPGVLSLVPGGAEAGTALTEAPEVGVISFTGSTAAGRKVGEAASRNLKRAHLELGGNNALIVLPGTDVAAAASAGAFGSYMHQGQICMTAGRHLVHESLYDEYVAALADKAKNLAAGNPATEQVALGPIIDEAQRDRIGQIVGEAVDAGARVAAGGTAEGSYYRPTVLADVDADNPAWTQEIFGPVAPVRSFATVDEAIATVNAGEYGLAVGVLGEVGAAMEVADRVEAGKVHINDQTVSDEANAPFGGIKDSGTGVRFGGAAANIEAFTETQWLTVKPGIGSYPF